MGRINWVAIIMVVVLLGGFMLVFNSESATTPNPSIGTSSSDSVIPLTLSSDGTQQQSTTDDTTDSTQDMSADNTDTGATDDTGDTSDTADDSSSVNTPYMDSLQQQGSQGATTAPDTTNSNQ